MHALNRFTFGPRLGEVAEVERMGLDRWFEAQLDPETLDDSALDARLAAFPAMTLAQEELIRRYPSAQLLRTRIERNLLLPRHPVEHSIYADDLAFYKEAQARKQAGETAEAKGTIWRRMAWARPWRSKPMRIAAACSMMRAPFRRPAFAGS